MLANLTMILGLLSSPVKPDTILPVNPVAKQDTIRTDTAKTAISTERKEPEAYMTQQVTYVSEFIKRFNNEITADGKPVPDSLKNSVSRRQVIDLLFDRFSKATLSKSSPLYTLKNRFLEEVCNQNDPIRLTFLSDDLYASLPVQVAYQGKEQSIDFYLKSVADGEGHAWKILDAQAPFLVGKKVTTRNKVQKDSVAFIPLNAQETAFLNLYNHIRDKHDLLQMAASPENPTPTLALLSGLVTQGQVTPIHTEYPVVYLPMDKGWVIQLHFNNRKHENSGWLITDLYQLPGTDTRRLPLVLSTYLTQNPAQK